MLRGTQQGRHVEALVGLQEQMLELARIRADAMKARQHDERRQARIYRGNAMSIDRADVGFVREALFAGAAAILSCIA